MTAQLSRYQVRWWPVVRNTLLIIGTYLAGSVSVMLAWPLWLWLIIEAALRYFPFWLQLVVLVFLGVQFDWLLNWPLGFGLLMLAVIWLVLVIGRQWRHPVVFVVWHLLIFVGYLGLTSRLMSELSLTEWWLQLWLYFVTLIVRVALGKQT